MNYIIFDLEATCWRGLPPKGVNEIIEIGALKINRFGEVVDEFSRFVRPVVNPDLSGFCKHLTSIQQEDVDRAEKFPAVIDAFIHWAGIYESEYLLCSWGSNDRNLLYNDCELHGVENHWTDNYQDIKTSYKQLKGLKNASGLKSTTKREGFEFTGVHHRAISDAENLAKIFIKYIEEWPQFTP